MAVTITAHAIIRYFERIEGVNMAVVRNTMRALRIANERIRGDSGVLQWMEHEGGYPVAAVRALFGQPMVERAIAVGASKVRVDLNCWVQIKNGVVVSCVTDDMARAQVRPGPDAKKTRKPYYPRRPNHRRDE
jgi:hypothetical protein